MKKLTSILVFALLPVVMSISFFMLHGRYITASGERIIENDLFRIEIADGVTYNRNIEKIIATFFESIEETTGLRFYPEAHTKEHDKIRIFFGDTRFLDHPVGYSTYSNFEGVFIHMKAMNETSATQDYIFEELLHEMVHCLQYRNGFIPSIMFAEGHAELTARYIYKDYNPRYNSLCLFSYSVKGELEVKIFSAKFEKYFTEMSYIYDALGRSGMHSGGDIFGVYLEKTYGINSYSRILRGFYDLKLANPCIEDPYELDLYQAEFIRQIKQETSDDVFTEFVAWYWEYTAQSECDFC